MQAFTRTISQPSNARTDANSDHVLLAWDPKIGIKQYKVQISSTPDFGSTVESVTTDNTSYAPTMTQFGYNAGGTLYWRVAGVDEDRNQGDWAPAQVIRLLPRLKLNVIGVVKRRHMSRIPSGRAWPPASTGTWAAATSPSPSPPPSAWTARRPRAPRRR
jgi:hypothetical protein